MSKDELIDLITIGIARTCVKEANGETVDKAVEIANVLLENGYHKASEVAEEIFEEIDNIMLEPITVWCTINRQKYDELKKKYTEGGE